MFIRSLASLLFVVIMAVWIGTFFSALNCPDQYSELLSAVSTVFAATIASGGVFLGFRRYQEQQRFKLAMDLPFSREILSNQKKFYEQYMAKIDTLKRLISTHGLNIPTSENSEFTRLKDSIFDLREEFEKWFSEDQTKTTYEIQKNFFSFYANTWLMNSRERKSEPNEEWRKIVEKQNENISELLDKGINTWRSELKKSFFVDKIVIMQEHIISKSGVTS